ncbi:HAD family hydrolase [Microvirga lotononidis]|uniref:Uncharacterized protein n=1 Tax=Microvirga lotononidis TaxID=864069 RepID=I4YR04_9HYPH|nr:hypothetical protein [Microvirga lotononidis]EIM26396.1 hypothetical protein MicloDRAFT_00029450 [Microvirga lotononidis]WQO30759.1 hypothetical protein U0023_25395 [Microvirga lotononidis]
MRTQTTSARAVLWGIDGTLLLSESINFRVLRLALYTEGVEASNEFHQEIVGQSATVVYKKCRQSFGISVSLNEWRRLKYSYCTAHAAEIAARPGALGPVCTTFFAPASVLSH